MKYAFHIFPSIFDTKNIDDVRAKYDPLSGKIPPHVTLVFPFDFDLAPEILISHARFAASRYRSFDITFGAPDLHDSYIWLPVVTGREKIEEMHDILYTGILRNHLSSSHDYIPHLTIARIGMDISSILPYAQKIRTGIKGMVDSIIIERILADDASETVICIPLK